MKDKKTKQLHSILENNEYETFKTYSKKTGVSMNQLIKNYISTIDEQKKENDITEQLQQISNIVNSSRFNIDSTEIENQLKESSKNTLSNLLDTFELFKGDFQENQNQIKNTVDSNITSLTELMKNQNEMIDKNFKSILFSQKDSFEAVLFLIASLISRVCPDLTIGLKDNVNVDKINRLIKDSKKVVLIQKMQNLNP